MMLKSAAPTLSVAQDAASRAKALGVTIEARYTVGEYDILILSAKQSTGLETWLTENHYRIPPGASRVLGTYLKLGMKFFVAKVNLKEQAKTGFKSLRPLQMAYESPKFMLPIRLGMVNADGPQELFVYALTREGRVETTNYRTVKIPSDAEIPEYVKDVFPDFYRSMFRTAAQKENLELAILVEGDPVLFNVYHVMQVNPDKFDLVNGPGGAAFVDFMVSDATQAIIKDFGVDKYGQPLFIPDAGKDESQLTP